jgi:hypothetical protein
MSTEPEAAADPMLDTTPPPEPASTALAVSELPAVAELPASIPAPLGGLVPVAPPPPAPTLDALIDAVGFEALLDDLSTHPKMTNKARAYLLATGPLEYAPLPTVIGESAPAIFYRPGMVEPTRVLLMVAPPARMVENGPDIPHWAVKGKFNGVEKSVKQQRILVEPYVFDQRSYAVLMAHYILRQQGVTIELPTRDQVANTPVRSATTDPALLSAADRLLQTMGEAGLTMLGVDPTGGVEAVAKRLGAKLGIEKLYAMFPVLRPAGAMTEEEGGGDDEGFSDGGVDEDAAEPAAGPPTGAARLSAAREVVVESLPVGWKWLTQGCIAQGPDGAYLTNFPSVAEMQGVGRLHLWSIYKIGINDNPGVCFTTKQPSALSAIGVYNEKATPVTEAPAKKSKAKGKGAVAPDQILQDGRVLVDKVSFGKVT